jgi:hypothetical protein
VGCWALTVESQVIHSFSGSSIRQPRLGFIEKKKSDIHIKISNLVLAAINVRKRSILAGGLDERCAIF